MVIYLLMLNTGLLTLQHMIPDKKDQQASGNPKGGQGDTEQIEDDFSGNGKYRDDYKRQHHGSPGHGLRCLLIIITCESKENRNISDGVHDGEEPHKDRCRME
jgi:hypothetical protein